MHRLRTRLSVVVRLTRWFLRRSLTLCARCDSHAERAGQVFCSRMGLCFGECPARMLSWKLRILTPTMSLSLLLSGCSHRRKGKLELGYSSPAWIDSLSLSLSLSLSTFVPWHPLTISPAIPLFLSLTSLNALDWVATAPGWRSRASQYINFNFPHFLKTRSLHFHTWLITNGLLSSWGRLAKCDRRCYKYCLQFFILLGFVCSHRSFQTCRNIAYFLFSFLMRDRLWSIGSIVPYVSWTRICFGVDFEVSCVCKLSWIIRRYSIFYCLIV